MQTSFVRELATLGPNTPYLQLLKDEFDFDVPPGALKYQVEYLYKYARQEFLKNTPKEQILKIAADKADELLKEMPWISKKYDDVIIEEKEYSVPSKGEMSDYPDGTIIFCEKRNKFLLYLNGQIVVRCSNIEKVKELAQKKLNFSNFID